MPIPRWIDEKGIPYDAAWYCSNCGWAIHINSYGIGKGTCPMCNGITQYLRVSYPQQSGNIAEALTT